MTDMINPAHYRGDRKFEPIEVIEDWNLNYRLGNALKYISRNGRKPGEDPTEGLKKAIWYLEREIASLDTPSGSYVPDEDGVYDEVLTYYGQTVDEKEAWPFEATKEDWEDFWSGDDADVLWDPSVGPVELSEDEIKGILSKKALEQFEDAEIVATVEKRGFILGIKKDGSTCELGGNGRCV